MDELSRLIGEDVEIRTKFIQLVELMEIFLRMKCIYNDTCIHFKIIINF